MSDIVVISNRDVKADEFFDNYHIKKVILDNVGTVGVNAFRCCRNLEEVEIRGPLYNIKYAAFKTCTALEKFEFKDTIKSIEDFAFASTAISEIDLKNLKCTFGSNVFKDAFVTEIKSLPDNFVIPVEMFDGCFTLTKANLSNVIEIDDSAFRRCINLKDVTFGKELKYIGEKAFKSTGFEKINFKDQELLEEIDDEAFSVCPCLSEFIAPKHCIKLRKDVVSNCVSLKKFVYPEDLSFIDLPYFENCDKLTEIVYPEKIKAISALALSDFKNEIHFPLFDNKIVSYQFEDITCNDIYIPEGIEYIENNAFNCSARLHLPSTLKEVENKNMFKDYRGDIVFKGTKEKFNSIFTNVSPAIKVTYSYDLENLLNEGKTISEINQIYNEFNK